MKTKITSNFELFDSPWYFGEEGEAIAVRGDIAEQDAKDRIFAYILSEEGTVDEDVVERLKRPLVKSICYQVFNETAQEDEWQLNFKSSAEAPTGYIQSCPVWFMDTRND